MAWSVPATAGDVAEPLDRVHLADPTPARATVPGRGEQPLPGPDADARPGRGPHARAVADHLSPGVRGRRSLHERERVDPRHGGADHARLRRRRGQGELGGGGYRRTTPGSSSGRWRPSSSPSPTPSAPMSRRWGWSGCRRSCSSGWTAWWQVPPRAGTRWSGERWPRRSPPPPPGRGRSFRHRGIRRPTPGRWPWPDPRRGHLDAARREGQRVEHLSDRRLVQQPLLAHDLRDRAALGHRPLRHRGGPLVADAPG